MKIDCAHDKLVPLEQIQPNPRNYNKHPDKQIDMLSKIINYQGQRSPIVVSNQSGFIVKGHGRLQAIQKLGWDTAAVDYQDYENEAQEYADMIADNKIAELSHTDPIELRELISELEIEDFELLGLDDFSLDDSLINEVNKGDENSEWVGMPEFDLADKEIKLTIIFHTELERENYVNKHDLPITQKQAGQWTSRL